MKSLICAALVFTITSFGTVAQADSSKELTIAIHDVFVPDVVPHDTDAKIVLTGMFPNSCYRWSRFEVFSPVQTIHEIKSKAFVTVGTMCLMVLVPFSKELNLGRLNPGEHTLRFTSGDDTYFERKMIVE